MTHWQAVVGKLVGVVLSEPPDVEEELSDIEYTVASNGSYRSENRSLMNASIPYASWYRFRQMVYGLDLGVISQNLGSGTPAVPD